MEKFCCLGDIIGARGGAFDSVITSISSGWFKFKDLVSMLASRGLSLGAKGRLYSACVRSLVLYGSETWPVKEEDQIRLERNDESIVRWMFSVRPEDRISEEELRALLKLKSMRDC